jgi:hypothetical protein
MARIHARKPLTRPATNLTANINQRLLGYATAATAAGVGVLALAQPAEAKIVYTPVNIPITLNGPAVQVDLNHDGIIDFSFINFSGSGICGADKGRRHDRAKVGHPNTQICATHYLRIAAGQPGNAIGSSQTFNGALCAAELRAGHTIESGRRFGANGFMIDAVAFSTFPTYNFNDCLWQGKGNPGGYLGLQFVAGGQTFYGWARVALTSSGPVLTGYAYETTPNHAIGAGDTGTGSAEALPPLDVPAPAPQPATLGLLANGAFGLNAWRRPEEMN